MNCASHHCSVSSKGVSRSPVIREKTKICVPHDCSASHDCIWTSTVGFVSFGLYLVSNKTCKNKTLVSPCQKKRLHIPLSNLTGDVRRRAKKSVPPATQLSYGNSCTCRSKKTFHLVFHALCRQHTFRDPSYPHVLRPKWPWQVLCCKHLSGSNSRHTSQRACRTRTNQTSS